MDNQLLQALMMGIGGGQGGGAGAAMPAAGGLATSGDSPFGQGGLSPQLLQFASGALSGGGMQGGVGKLLGGMLAQRMKQHMQPQQSSNPLDALFQGGDPGMGGQPTA